MYMKDFDLFSQEAVELFRARPKETRYQIKYREGKLVLKVTDDIKCLQFKSDQQADFKRLERLTERFFALTSTGEEPLALEASDPMAVDSGAGVGVAGANFQKSQGGGKQSNKRRKG